MGVLLYGGSAERLGPERLRALREAAADLRVVVTEDDNEIERVLPETVVAVRRIPVAQLERAPNLRWFQRWYAGVEDIVKSAVLQERRVLVTNASGVHGQPMAEHVFALILGLGRRINASVRFQLVGQWPEHGTLRPLEVAGKTMLIVGYGAIGRRIGEVAEAFSMHVTAVARRARAGVHPVEKLDMLLPDADYVVNALPHTAETHRLFNESTISTTKEGAVFVNVGRGATVDHDALVRALQSGRISAAGLDVTDPEPLPEDSPLWEMENVIITPHIAGLTPMYGSRVWDIFLENLARFHAGRDLINLVDWTAGY